jgi:hypothetical protein
MVLAHEATPHMPEQTFVNMLNTFIERRPDKASLRQTAQKGLSKKLFSVCEGVKARGSLSFGVLVLSEVGVAAS